MNVPLNPKTKLTANQQRFVAEYLVDLSATEAAKRAGLEVRESGYPSGFYVYGLIDPSTSSLFYIGKGTRWRWVHHYGEPAGSGNQRKRERARVCAFRRCVIFASGLSSYDAVRLERLLIGELRSHLTNIAPGHRSRIESWRARAGEILGEFLGVAARARTASQEDFYTKCVNELRRMLAMPDSEAALYADKCVLHRK